MDSLHKAFYELLVFYTFCGFDTTTNINSISLCGVNCLLDIVRV